MNALRRIVENINGMLHIQLPAEINTRQVEVIVLPVEPSTDAVSKRDMTRYNGCISSSTAAAMLRSLD